MSTVLLRMAGISKEFPGVKALEDVNFTVRTGEVHVLMGENGAGKSTLLKILSGAYQCTNGKIWVKGREVTGLNPIKAGKLGIFTIYQELNLLPNLTVTENVFLGKMPLANRFLGTVRFREMVLKTKSILEDLGIHVNPDAKVQDLPIADRQMIEIAKALLADPDILVMDEPTSSLSKQEVERLFSVIRKLKSKGKGIIFISHRIEELWKIGDRITILRGGRVVLENALQNVDENMLIKAMVGKEIKERFPGNSSEKGQEVLNVRNLSRQGKLHDITFSLKKGEILGIAGLVGAGRTELVRAIYGADPIDSGEIYLNGKKTRIRHPSEAIHHGIALIPEDRKGQGLLLGMGIKENITLPILKYISPIGVIDKTEEKRLAEEFKTRLQIKTPDVHFKTINLSGGNQQKVVLAKWLCAKAKVFIFDEPTRGIDVGAKTEVYQNMIELTKQGVSIIMISSELPEIMGMSDRILVMHQGKVTAIFEKDEADSEKILSCMMGRYKN
ncbi:ribose transport system ATP-binding protein [Paenibacillus sp. V4I3]|uniref:sugar ABC transporter ATP-binding protein n=1 Tax=unclassified Paenibacillus TaxID=185978 RepID=UPI002787E89D|nr:MULTISPECIES: sugar ABC transporter ATP-binding protein [unclassified Paenibacillus]MDQ0874422.1 ribose transport system ATP-binding protein [Paenibacillus sp. V4I3]MDQ0889864.1 ribose transport system ATP-binding protein [Paenibacillus sp. V4I9]